MFANLVLVLAYTFKIEDEPVCIFEKTQEHAQLTVSYYVTDGEQLQASMKLYYNETQVGKTEFKPSGMVYIDDTQHGYYKICLINTPTPSSPQAV